MDLFKIDFKQINWKTFVVVVSVCLLFSVNYFTALAHSNAFLDFEWQFFTIFFSFLKEEREKTNS